MEDDACLHDEDAHYFTGKQGLRLFLESKGGLGTDLGPDDALANVLDEEGEEDAGHDDGRGCRLVGEFAETFVCEHEVGMGVELSGGWLDG